MLVNIIVNYYYTSLPWCVVRGGCVCVGCSTRGSLLEKTVETQTAGETGTQTAAAAVAAALLGLLLHVDGLGRTLLVVLWLLVAALLVAALLVSAALAVGLLGLLGSVLG